MNKIKLSNGETLPCEGVVANPATYLGVTRDALTFTFDPEEISLDKMLDLFTPENCAAVVITDGSGTYVHENYTIRIGAGVSCRDLALRGGIARPIQETQPTAWVTMAQSTPAERQMQVQQEILDALVAAALEV